MPTVYFPPDIRAALHEDIIEVWAVTRIYDSRPLLPGKPADIPRAFVMLQDLTDTAFGSGTAGIGEISAPHVYAITGQFNWPEDGTPIEIVKEAMANAMLARLTLTSPRYNGYRILKPPTVQFTISEPTNAEQMFEVTINLTLEVVTAF